MADLFDVICALDDAADDLRVLHYDDDASTIQALSDRLKRDIELRITFPDDTPEAPRS